MVKSKLCKSDQTCQSYDKTSSVLFFLAHSVLLFSLTGLSNCAKRYIFDRDVT